MNNVEVIGQMDNTIDNTFESANRVYSDSGLSPTIPTCGGGGLQPKILEVGYMDNATGKHQSNTVYDENALCPNITTVNGGGTQQIKVCESQIVAMRGRNPDNPSDRTTGSATEQRLEPNTQGTSNCLTSVQKDNLVIEESIIQRARGFNKGGQYEICPPVTAHSFQENNLLKCQYCIRKLTPKECGRLMGVSDEDIDKMAAVNSNTQLYKQYGNSIVVDVMCTMFRNLHIEQK